ncbi:uncharacterized protein LOC132697887 [Cylas formicarius]|uniref:uncharacterized protein LOC132697887 n=1 Tax=Cylas formicarius TaxID=197179 RepID=UPI002958D7ED|nr:uncharacterized protein LOC132697887 [Cylas formicarius]
MKTRRKHPAGSNGSPQTQMSKPNFSSLDAYFKTNANLKPKSDFKTFESPYKNLLSEIETADGGEESPFQTPKPTQPKRNIKWEISKSKVPSKKRSKKRKCLANSTIKIIENNLRSSDVNSEHLQMGIMLSKSSFEAENNTQSSSSLDDMPDMSALTSTILERFGFRSNKTVEPRKWNELSKQRKRFKYVTPILLSRSEEDREALISSKISLILQNVHQAPRSTSASPLSLHSIKLNELYCRQKCVFNIDNIYDSGRFKIPSLNLPPNVPSCGRLLKKWNEIPGRDISPLRTDEKIKSTPEKTIEPTLSPSPGLSRSMSPELFGSEDELTFNKVRGNDSPIINKNPTQYAIPVPSEDVTRFNSQETFPSVFSRLTGEEHSFTEVDLEDVCSNIDFEHVSASQIEKSLSSSNKLQTSGNSDYSLLDTLETDKVIRGSSPIVSHPNKLLGSTGQPIVDETDFFDDVELKSPVTPDRVEKISVTPKRSVADHPNFIYISSGSSSNDYFPIVKRAEQETHKDCSLSRSKSEGLENKSTSSLRRTFSESLNVTSYIMEMLNSQESFMESEVEGCNLSQQSTSSALCDEELNYSSYHGAPIDTDLQFDGFSMEKEARSADENVFDIDCLEEDTDCHKSMLKDKVGEFISIDEATTGTSEINVKINDVVTPNRNGSELPNVVVKTKNVTPMLDYDNMNTPTIAEELDKFGIKPLKRKRGAMLLKYIYDSTHPVIEKKSKTDENDQLIKKRRNNRSYVDGIKCSPPIEIAEDILENENLDDLIFERKQSTKICSCRIPLQIVWHNLVSSNPIIRENILLYEPLQLESLYMMIKDLGFRFHIQDLLTFLDKKCITVRIKQNQAKKSIFNVKAYAVNKK